MLQFVMGLSAFNRAVIEREHEFAKSPKNLFALEYIKLVKEMLALKHGSNANNSGIGDTNTLQVFTDQQFAKRSAKLLNAMMNRANLVGMYVPTDTAQECADEGLVLFLTLFNHKFADSLFQTKYHMSFECPGCQHECINADENYRTHLNDSPLDYNSLMQLCRMDANMLINAETNNTNQLIQTAQNKFVSHLKSHTSRLDGWRCDKCGVISQHIVRHEQLQKISEIIIVMFNKFHVKRYDYFPQYIKIKSPFKGPIGDYHLHYKMIGKVEQSGNMNGGHYQCTSYRPAAQPQLSQMDIIQRNMQSMSIRENAQPQTPYPWYNCNDSYISVGCPAPTNDTFYIAYHIIGKYED
jgi:hypothetical protein